MDLDEVYQKLYRYCWGKTGQPQTAEDITQETFLRFFVHYPQRQAANQLPLLYTIARNLCTDYYRCRQTVPLEEIPEEHFALEPAYTADLALAQAMEKLTPTQQELVFLRYINGISVGNLAKLLGVSRFTVRRRLKTALAILKEELKDD